MGQRILCGEFWNRSFIGPFVGLAETLCLGPEEEVVYDFVTELSTKHAVSDELFDRAKKLLGEQQVVELTGVGGAYGGVAMMLAMAEEGVPLGKEPPFNDSDP